MTWTNNKITQSLQGSFESSFNTVVSNTEQELISSVRKPGAIDYLKKLSNKRWGIWLTVATLSLGGVALNKSYNSKQSDLGIIQDRFHITMDSTSTNGWAVEQIVEQAHKLSSENDVSSYTDALPDHDKKSLKQFLESMSVDSTLYIKNNDLFISSENLQKILDENANRWIVEHRESSSSSSMIWWLALLIWLLMLWNYTYKATKYEYQKQLQDISKKAKEIQREYEKTQSVNQILFDIIKAHKVTSWLSEAERVKQLSTAKNIKSIFIEPYFSSSVKPLIKWLRQPWKPFPIEYSYNMLVWLSDGIISTKLQQKIKDNKSYISTLIDASQFSLQAVTILDQYDEVMQSLQKELDIFISNENTLSTWKQDKQQIISQVFVSPEITDLSARLKDVSQDTANTTNELEQLQLENKANSWAKQEKKDKQIGVLTTQIEMEWVGSSEFAGLSFDDLKGMLREKINDHGDDIIFDEALDSYIYTNTEKYEQQAELEQDKTDVILKRINTMYWLLQLRKITSDRWNVSETANLKNRLEDLRIEEASLKQQLNQLRNPKWDIIGETIIKAIDDIIEWRIVISWSSDTELFAHAYKHIINQLLTKHQNVFKYDEGLTEQLVNKVNTVDKNIWLDSIMFGSHRWTTVMGWYHATRQVLNIEQISNLFDNPNHYMAAWALIAIVAWFGVHKFIHGVEHTAQRYETWSMDNKMSYMAAISQSAQWSKARWLKLALFLWVALTTMADVWWSIATITSTHQKNEATKQVMDGNNMITRSIDDFENFIGDAQKISLGQAKQTIIDEAKEWFAWVLTGKKSALLFGNDEVIEDPMIKVERDKFNSGYASIANTDRWQLQKIWSNYEKNIEQILSKKVIIDGESILFRWLPWYIARQNTGLTNLNITQNIDHAKKLYQEQTEKAIESVTSETKKLNQQLWDLEEVLSGIWWANISFQKINNNQLLDKLNSIESQWEIVWWSLENMNVYYNILSKEGIIKTIDALRKNAHDPKMWAWILLVSLATLHLTGATTTRSRKSVNKKIKSPHTNSILNEAMKDLMHYAYLAAQQDSNLKTTYDSIANVIKDETHIEMMVDQYLLLSSTPQEAVDKIKSIVLQNKDSIDNEMWILYADMLLWKWDDAPKKVNYSELISDLSWIDSKKTRIIFTDLFIGSESFRKIILNDYLDDKDIDISDLSNKKDIHILDL